MFRTVLASLVLVASASAVRVSCGGLTLDRFDLGRIQEFNTCRQTAMSNAVARINSPLVYAAAHVPQQGQMARR